MSLGDIFDRSFKLLGKTWLRSLITAAIILVPASLLLALGLQSLFSAMASFPMTRNPSPEQLQEFGMVIGSHSILIFLGALAFSLGSVAARQAVTMITCSQFAEEELSWREALSVSFRSRVWKALGQSILEGLALGAVVLIPYVTIIVSVILRQTVFAVIGGLLFIPAIGLMMYLYIKWVFTGTVIAHENSGVMDSFGRSAYLVQGNWWRVCGMLLLLGIVAQFAISIITTPVQMVTMWGFWQKYFEFISHASRGGSPDPSGMFQMFSSMGIGLGITVALSSILSTVVQPVYMAVMYFDQRARKNEFFELGQEYRPDDTSSAR